MTPKYELDSTSGIKITLNTAYNGQWVGLTDYFVDPCLDSLKRYWSGAQSKNQEFWPRKLNNNYKIHKNLPQKVFNLSNNDYRYTSFNNQRAVGFCDLI